MSPSKSTGLKQSYGFVYILSSFGGDLQSLCWPERTRREDPLNQEQFSLSASSSSIVIYASPQFPPLSPHEMRLFPAFFEESVIETLIKYLNRVESRAKG